MGLEEDVGTRPGGKEMVPPREVCCTTQADVMMELAYHDGGEVIKPAEKAVTWTDHFGCEC